MQDLDNRIEGIEDFFLILPVSHGIAEPAQHGSSFLLSAETADCALIDEFQKFVNERGAEPQARVDRNIVFAKMLPALGDLAVDGLLDSVIELCESALLIEDLLTDAFPTDAGAAR